MQLRHFERDEVLFTEGEAGHEAYRIVSGHVSITITEGGKTSHLGILYPGEILGEMAMIEDKPRAATARALTPTVVEVITEENFLEVVVQDPERLRAYLGTLFERLRGMGVRLRHALRHEVTLPATPPAAVPDSPGSAIPATPLSPTNDPGVVISGSRSGEAFEVRVNTFPYRIGRKLHSAVASVFVSNDLNIEDSQPYQVSRNHCLIARTATGFYVEDRGSKLGTVVNGIPIGEASLRMTAPLQKGENLIILGALESRVRLKAVL